MNGGTRTGKGGGEGGEREARKKETYKADTADIQHERHHSVQEETPKARVVKVGNTEGGDLSDQRNQKIHGSADGRKVVQTNERVHLLAVALKQNLDHDEAHGLEHDSTELVEETLERESDLAEAGKSDTKDN